MSNADSIVQIVEYLKAKIYGLRLFRSVVFKLRRPYLLHHIICRVNPIQLMVIVA